MLLTDCTITILMNYEQGNDAIVCIFMSIVIPFRCLKDNYYHLVLSVMYFLLLLLFWWWFQKAALVWSPAPEAAHAHVSKPSPNSAAGTPPTPAPTPGGGGGAGQQQQQQQQHNNNNNNNNTSNSNNNNHHASHHSHHAHLAHHHAPSGSSSNNPPAQAGLMHWMSVMAEHITNPHHHDVHYMWNGVEVRNQPTLPPPFPLLPMIPKRKKYRFVLPERHIVNGFIRCCHHGLSLL